MAEIKFNEQDLQKWAGNHLFTTGKRYFRQQKVKQIVVTDYEKYVAEVKDNKIHITTYYPANNSFSCTCGSSRFCKHSVALGFKILQEKNNLLNTVPKEFYEISSEKKILFFKQALCENNNYRQDFIKFVRQLSSEANLQEIKEKLWTELTNITKKEIYDAINTKYHNDYQTEYDAVVDIIVDIMQTHKDEFAAYCKYNDIKNTIDYLFVIYNALILVKNDSNADINNFIDDITEYIIPFCKQTATVLRTKTDNQKQEILPVLFKYFKKFGLQYNIFSELLNIFSTPTLGKHLIVFLTDYAQQEQVATHIVKLASAQGRKDLVEKYAKEYTSNTDITTYFLEQLQTHRKFNEIAEILAIRIADNDFCNYHNFITPNLPNYKFLLKNLLTNCKIFAFYLELKKIATNKEINTIIERLKKENATILLAEIYLHEKQKDNLIQLLTNELDNKRVRNFIARIERKYPKEAWQLHKKIVETDFRSERSRVVYRKLAQRLKKMQQLYPNETEPVILNLYNHRLKALKEEFRKAGLLDMYEN